MMIICMSITVFNNDLMINDVLTILGNFVMISNELDINRCVQIEEYTHFYRFLSENYPISTDF